MCNNWNFSEGEDDETLLCCLTRMNSDYEEGTKLYINYQIQLEAKMMLCICCKCIFMHLNLALLLHYIIICIFLWKILSLGGGSCENDTFPKGNYLKNSSWFMSHSLTPFYYCATISNILAAICGYWQHITFIGGILKESTKKAFWD